MATRTTRWYVESSIYVSLLMKEEAFENGFPRWQLAEGVIAKAQRGEVQLVTSTYTIVEVNGGQAMGTDMLLRRRVSSLFQRPYLDLIEVDRLIAESARDLIWSVRDTGLSMKNDDMIHLATAMEENCDALLTWDDKHLLKLTDRFGVKIQKPDFDGQQLPLPQTT